MATLLDFFAYFQDLTTARRATPTGDLASAIANARLDGEYLSDFDTASYYVIIATAGHDTTSSTIAGGLHALIQHPAEMARLRDDPALLAAQHITPSGSGRSGAAWFRDRCGRWLL
jgi:cytochrome P450